MKPSLVLNADYTPLRAISWQRAMRLAYKQVVDVVTYYKTPVLDTKGREHPVPAVVVLRKYIRNSKRVKFSKKNVFIRDNYQCQYCGKKLTPDQLTYDHVIPKSKIRNKTTQTRWTNIVTACIACNKKKANQYCAEAQMFPLNKPREPSIYEILPKSFTVSGKTPKEWTPWLQTQKE